MITTRLAAARMRRYRIGPALALVACLGLASLAARAAGPAYGIQEVGGWGPSGSAEGLDNNGRVIGLYHDQDAVRLVPAIWEGGTLTQLPTPGEEYFLQDFNDRGHVLGVTTWLGEGGDFYEEHAVLWNGEETVDLTLQHPDFDPVHPWVPVIYPTAVNNTGQVLVSTPLKGSFLWENGTFTELPPLPGSPGVGRASTLNDHGHVIGSCETADGEQHAVIWINGVPTDMGPFGPVAVNSLGQVAGSAYTQQFGGCAVVWKDGALIDLLPGHLGALQSRAVDINDLGQVVGNYYLEGGVSRGFIWKDDNNSGTAEAGEFLDLGSLGGSWVAAADINHFGQVLGVSAIDGGNYHTFVWENGAMTDLSLDQVDSRGIDINDMGQVLFYDAGAQPFRSYLATPVNTPSGANVEVNPTSSVGLLFDTVLTSGETTVTSTGPTEEPLPANFRLAGAHYYEISTTATFSGSVVVSVRYEQSQFPDDQNVCLLHFENGAWVDITTGLDPERNVVFGETTSFSPFAVAQRLHTWSGALQPVNADGSSIFKLGSTVPVKFQLTGDSAGITNLSARLYVAKLTDGVLGDEIEAVSNSASDAGNTFRYSGGQYQFNLGTRSLSQGTWRMRIDLGDGVLHTVDFSLRK